MGEQSYIRARLSKIRKYFLAKIFSLKLRKLAAKCRTIDDCIALSFNFNLITIAPTQVKDEIIRLLKLLKKLRPKFLLEIGTANGGTLFLFCQIASPNATVISIDLPEGPFGGGYPSWRIPFYKAFARHNQRIHLLREDSHDFGTLSKVKEILDNHSLDFLFIDGDHTYEGVKKDFEMYSPLVRKGGIIALHDICPGPQENVGGVPIFWNEIKQNFVYDWLVKDWNQGGYGIGIVYA